MTEADYILKNLKVPRNIRIEVMKEYLAYHRKTILDPVMIYAHGVVAKKYEPINFYVHSVVSEPKDYIRSYGEIATFINYALNWLSTDNYMYWQGLHSYHINLHTKIKLIRDRLMSYYT